MERFLPQASGLDGESLEKLRQEYSVRGHEGRLYEFIMWDILTDMVQEGSFHSIYRIPINAYPDGGLAFIILSNDSVAVPFDVIGSESNMTKRRNRHPDIPAVHMKNRGKSQPLRPIQEIKNDTLGEVIKYVAKL